MFAVQVQQQPLVGRHHTFDEGVAADTGRYVDHPALYVEALRQVVLVVWHMLADASSGLDHIESPFRVGVGDHRRGILRWFVVRQDTHSVGALVELEVYLPGFSTDLSEDVVEHCGAVQVVTSALESEGIHLFFATRCCRRRALWSEAKLPDTSAPAATLYITTAPIRILAPRPTSM